MPYKNSTENNNWNYSNKSLKEIFEKNEHVKNIRKKLIKAKIEKQFSKHSNFHDD